jgi:serine/threonine protein kinase
MKVRSLGPDAGRPSPATLKARLSEALHALDEHDADHLCGWLQSKCANAIMSSSQDEAIVGYDTLPEEIQSKLYDRAIGLVTAAEKRLNKVIQALSEEGQNYVISWLTSKQAQAITSTSSNRIFLNYKIMHEEVRSQLSDRATDLAAAGEGGSIFVIGGYQASDWLETLPSRTREAFHEGRSNCTGRADACEVEIAETEPCLPLPSFHEKIRSLDQGCRKRLMSRIQCELSRKGKLPVIDLHTLSAKDACRLSATISARAHGEGIAQGDVLREPSASCASASMALAPARSAVAPEPECPSVAVELEQVYKDLDMASEMDQMISAQSKPRCPCMRNTAKSQLPGSHAPVANCAETVTVATVVPACETLLGEQTFELLYECLGEPIGQGAYGTVWRARCLRTGERVAVKHIRSLHGGREGFPKSSIREIKALRNLEHPNIVRLLDICVAPPVAPGNSGPGDTYMVFEYAPCDLTGFLEYRKRHLQPSEIKCLFMQIIDAIDFCHMRGVMHRDLKPANVLIAPGGCIKVCDFGLCRSFTHEGRRVYTQNVVTLWYRPPELLLQAKMYDQSVDIWSAGCILGELLMGRILFPEKSGVDVLQAIIRRCGVGSANSWPESLSHLPLLKLQLGLDSSGAATTAPPTAVAPAPGMWGAMQYRHGDKGTSLVRDMMMLDPASRISAYSVLRHSYFSEAPLPCQRTEVGNMMESNRPPAALSAAATQA